VVLLSRQASLALAVALGCAASVVATGEPRGAMVVQGSATIATDGATTTITNTPGTIINWEQFSVAPDEVTRFVQRDASSAVLNRVIGSQRSDILGQMLSNGRVFLINPNGIAIGAGARINTAGFVASSLNLSDADFVSGRQRFEGTGREGAVVSRGVVETPDGGAVYLIAPSVENHGVITTPNGEILLAAGHSAELVAAASPNLRVRISAPEGGEAVNVGQLVANAGRIGLFGASVRSSGLVDASSASVNARGEIVLSATGDALVEADSRFDASNSAGRGGDITLLGARVAVLEDAIVDASGATGGGAIRVGGDYLGSNADFTNAAATVIAPTATLRADAHHQGDGGRIIVWSEEYTGFFGTASVRGAGAYGDGGFVETSSRGNLQALGTVDAGLGGEWLLDPYDITIRVAANSNGNFSGGNPNLFTPVGDSAVASRDQIQASLNAGTSVTVATGGAGSPGTQAGTISVLAPITKSAGGAATLTLDAASNISFSGSGVTSTSGALNLSLASASGAITGLPSLNLNGGTLTLSSTAASGQAAGAVISGNTSVIKAGSSTFTYAGNNTYTGATTITGGVLQLGAANRIPNNSPLFVGALGTLNLNGYAETLGALGGNGSVMLGAGTLTVGSGNVSSAFSGVMSGTGRLTKTGTGTFTLGGANSYSGLTTISGGTLLLAAADRIADASALSIASAGTLNLGGFNETVASLAGAGRVTLGTGVLTAGGNNTNTTYSGVMSGSGGLTKIGTGTLTLSGANTYTGATTINAGTLALSGSNRIGDQSAVTVAAGATFNLGTASDTIGSLAGAGNVTVTSGTLSVGQNNTSTTFGGVIGGAGRLTKVGTGTLTLGGANTYTGLTTISAGTLALGAANRIADGSALSIAAAGTLDLGGFDETVASITGAGATSLGAGVLTTGGNNSSTTYSGVMSGSGGLTKIGTGTLTLSGGNTYTGATTINAGTLTLGGSNRIGDQSAVTVASGATFSLGTSSDTIGSLAGAGNVTLTSGALVAGQDNTSTNFGGVISGGGAFTKAGTGTLTLSGANTYTGATTVAAGTILLGAAERLSDSTALTVQAGAAFNLNSYAETVATIAGGGSIELGAAPAAGITSVGNASSTFSGVLSGAGSLTKLGTGVLTLSGANSYQGATTVNAGTLVAQSDSALGGIVGGTSVADGATLQLSNAAVGAEPLNLTGSGVAGAGALIGDGVASVAGPVTLAGATRIGTVNAASSLTLGGTVDGGFALSLAGAGPVVLNGPVGGLVPLASLTTSATPVVLGGGNVSTTGLQSYTSRVTLAADTLLASTAGGDITLTDVSGAAFDLAVNTAGATALSGLDGLDALSTDAEGTAALSGTVGAAIVTINEAAPSLCGTLGSGGGAVSIAGAVTLCGDTTVSGTAVLFGSTVDSDASARALTVNASGTTDFLGDVGATQALGDVTTDAAGLTRFHGGAAALAVVQTSGTQTFNDAVELVAEASGQTRRFASSNGAAITFARTVDSPGAAARLVVDTSGVTTFGGAVGANAALDSVTTDAPGSVALDGGLVRTTGAQTYDDAVILGGPTSLVTIADGGLTAGGAFDGVAGTLTLDLGAGAAVLTNAANDFGVVEVASASAVTLVDADALVLGGAQLSGMLHVTAGGAVTQSAPVAAATLSVRTLSDAGAAITLTDAGNDVDAVNLQARNAGGDSNVVAGVGYVDADDVTVQGLQTAGAATVSSSGTIRVDADVAAGSLTIRSTAADIVLAAGRTLTTDGAGTPLVLDAARRFVNDGATLVPGTGRWVIYSADPALDQFGGLASGQTALWGSTSASLAPEAAPAGNRYVFGVPRTLTFSSVDATKIYGDDSATLVSSSWLVTGLETDTFGGAFLPDDPATAYSGTPMVTSTGSLGTAAVAGSPYRIDIAPGTLSAGPGFALTFDSAGNLTVAPRPIDVVADDVSKQYGEADPPLTYVPTGLVNGDALNGALTRDPGETVLGSPYRITQGTLTDASNPNYLITFTGGYFTVVPGSVTPDNRALELALIQARQEWFAPACVQPQTVSLPGVFAVEQERLDRAASSLRTSPRPICRASLL